MGYLLAAILAAAIWFEQGLAQTAPAPLARCGGDARGCPGLPPALASLLEIRRPQGTVGPMRGLERPVGLPARTAWTGDRFLLVWAAPEARQRGWLSVGGVEVAEGLGSATIPLPSPGVTEWNLRLADGSRFSGRVRRLGEGEIQAVEVALDRAQTEGRGDAAETAALQLEVYVAHELYASALGYLARRPALVQQEPFASLGQGIQQAMAVQ